MKNSLLLKSVMETPWALLPSKLAVVMEVVERHVAGEKLSAEEVQLRIGAGGTPMARQASGVAVLPLFGTIVPRAGVMTDTSGVSSAERFGQMFRAAVADTNVGAIVIDVNSPGGAVSGIEELGTEIFKARGSKPIVAVANFLAASAAYWLATAADELVVSPSAEVGSIGVFGAHQDVSKALENEGVKVTLVSAGKFKTEGNPYEPLSEEAKASLQARIEEYYGMFVKAVARNRGVKADDVRNGFGQGRTVGAQEAVQLGMADRVGTLAETIQRMQKGGTSGRSARADLEFRERRARAFSGD